MTSLLITPPEDDEAAELRRVLGHAGPAMPARSAGAANPAGAAAEPHGAVAGDSAEPAKGLVAAPSALPAPGVSVVWRLAPKVTKSVRVSPETEASLAAIGQALGWSANKLMTALVESSTVALARRFEREGVAGALNILVSRPADDDQ
jgi:hypothetical protein